MSRLFPYILLVLLWIGASVFNIGIYNARINEYDAILSEKIETLYENLLQGVLQQNRLLFFENIDNYEYGKTLHQASIAPNIDTLASLGILLESFASPFVNASKEELLGVTFYDAAYRHIRSVTKKNEAPVRPKLDAAHLQKIKNYILYIGDDGRFHFVQKILFQGSVAGYIDFQSDIGKSLARGNKEKSLGLYTFLENTPLEKKDSVSEETIFGEMSRFIASLKLADKNQGCFGAQDYSLCAIAIRDPMVGRVGYLAVVREENKYKELRDDLIFKTVTLSAFFLLSLYLFYKTERVTFMTRRLGKILEESNDEILLYDIRSGKIIQTNKRLRKKLDYSESEIYSLAVTEILPTLDLLELRDFTPEKSVVRYCKFKKKGGGEYDIRVNIQRFKDTDNDIVLFIAEDITNELELKEQVFLQKEFLQTVIDTIPHPIFVKDSNLKYIMINNSALTFLNAKEKNDVIGKDDFEIDISLDNAKTFTEQDLHVLLTKETLTLESEEMSESSGQTKWYQIIKTPLGNIGYPKCDDMLLGVATDITMSETLKHKLAGINNELNIRIEKEIENRFKSEERYKDLFENINEAILVLKIEKGNCKIVELNFNATKLFKKDKTELLRTDFRNLFGLEADYECSLDKMAQNETYEDKIKILIEETFRVLIMRTRSYFYNKSHYIIVSLTDISEHEQLKKEKREHKKLFETLFKKANSGICILDENGAFVKHNRGFCKMVGYEANEVKQFDFAYFLTPEAKERFNAENKKIFEEQKDIQDAYTLVNKEGNTLDAIGSSVILYSDTKKFRLMILEDITKLKTLEGKQKEQERLMAQQAKMAEMGDMIGAIAHQWRQPLNSINAAAIKLRLLDDLERLDSAGIKDTTLFIEEQSNKMSETINDFLNFFKPSREKEHFYLEKVINNINKMLGVQLLNRNIRFSWEVENNLEIYGFKNELEHVLLNIVTNARDAFEGKNLPNQSIFIQAAQDEKSIFISVQDTAGGIQDAIIEKIFNPYFTTKATDKGTGIGLYMAKSIIERSFEGKIEARNFGEGARFDITLKRGNNG